MSDFPEKIVVAVYEPPAGWAGAPEQLGVWDPAEEDDAGAGVFVAQGVADRLRQDRDFLAMGLVDGLEREGDLQDQLDAMREELRRVKLAKRALLKSAASTSAAREKSRLEVVALLRLKKEYESMPMVMGRRRGTALTPDEASNLLAWVNEHRRICGRTPSSNQAGNLWKAEVSEYLMIVVRAQLDGALVGVER